MNEQNVFLADSGVYASVARGIIKFGVPTDIYLPNNPPHIFYPPFFSYLWAIVLLIVPEFEHIAIRLLVLFFGSLTLLVTWFFLKDWNVYIRTLTVINIALNYYFLSLSTSPLSDIPYMFFSILFIALIKYAKTNRNVSIVSGVILSFATLTRSIGITLLAELFLLFLICYAREKKKFIKSNLNLIIIMVIFLSINIIPTIYTQTNVTKNQFPNHMGLIHTYKEYFIYGETLNIDNSISLNKLIQRYKVNTFRLMSTVPTLFFYQYHEVLNNVFNFIGLSFLKKIISLLIFLLVLIGIIQSLKEKVFNGAAYCLAYIFMLMNFEVADRYMIVLLPLLYNFIFIGLSASFGKRIGKIMIISMLCIGLISSSFGVIEFVKMQNNSNNNNTKSYLDVVLWLKNNAQKNEIVMTVYPEGNYLYSNLKSIGVPLTYNTTEVHKAIINYNVTWIIEDSVNSFSELFLTPALKEKRELITQVYKKDNTTIYRVNNSFKNHAHP